MKMLILKGGAERVVTGEQGKYWVCGTERFRKLGSLIEEVRDIPEPNAEAEAEVAVETEALAEAPKPKKKSRKKKKEETAEDTNDGERGE